MCHIAYCIWAYKLEPCATLQIRGFGTALHCILIEAVHVAQLMRITSCSLTSYCARLANAFVELGFLFVFSTCIRVKSGKGRKRREGGI